MNKNEIENAGEFLIKNIPALDQEKEFATTIVDLLINTLVDLNRIAGSLEQIEMNTRRN